MDLERVATIAAKECIRQQVGILGLIRLLTAYDHVFNDMPWISPNKAEVKVFDIRVLGGMVEHTNRGELRSIPVTFANGGSSCSPDSIPAAMASLMSAIPDVVGNEFEIRAWIKHFLWIHPFTDGNGRTAWVLYNWLCQTMNTPTPLPDFGWME